MTTHLSISSGVSQCDAMEALFKQKPNEWVSMLELHEVSGSMNVHSRIADLRHRGMKIENRSDRDGSKIKSFYRYNPQP